ncbi:hypothetical protein SRB5_26080 [Streptomyces sp. RB5]|uniref:Halogenase n=1 Tax=Streptomyces smaragdinus TaxID=2585196 RepID=A0A7K0CIC0_9ACTN|nr:NAD(P)/FAD-dependent oxidoreductase [Streptomyces smaragdinus]MQY12474.1 hypothetical protein [Streptomyces smaragdinus]
MAATPPTRTSVAVIGGGPAGSTAAALLARSGIDVVVLERAKFPRYHIGESLLASCPLVLELSGAMEKVDAAGFTEKRGGLFRWGSEQDWVVNWLDVYGPDRRSWLVDRAKFDKILLDNAREQGAVVYEEAIVHDVEFDDGRPVAVEWSGGPDGAPRQRLACDWVIDASGRAGVLSAQKLKDREHHEVFQNVAAWGYWQGGKTLPNTPPGGLNSISAKDGWYWLIPLSDGRLSCGYVTHRDVFRRRRAEYSSLEEMVKSVVMESEHIRPLIDGCEFVGPARAEQDYSYAAEKFCGPGYMLSGDAACFLDPLLSTGVHLALYSATIAAAGIVAMRDGTVSETEVLAFYEYCYRRSYARLLTLVGGMYEQYGGKQTYFWSAHNLSHQVPLLDREAVGERDFVDLSAGLSDFIEAQKPDGEGYRRVLTDQLVLGAHKAQYDAVALGKVPADRGPFDFSYLDENNHYQREAREAEVEEAAGFTLVTEPRLGLARIGTPAEESARREGPDPLNDGGPGSEALLSYWTTPETSAKN